MKKNIILAALAIASAHACAADKTWYVGGDISSTQLKDQDDKQRKTGFGATLGYSLSENFAVELQARRLGVTSSTDTFASVTYQAKVRTHSLSASVLGILPLNNEFSLFGRVGYARNTLHVAVKSSDASANIDERGHSNKALFGFGGNYQFDKHLGLRLEYVNLGKNKVTLSGDPVQAKIQQFNLGLNYSF